ncbi:MAG TPA: phosphate ABC transporter permease PstA [Arenimonas sp.]|uniref:phosphate ABC transporter permease PstA n=1 Tax=Arenimonas sp. TaxID=1872635 RepID=UPI002BCC1060|nr:phosphate ABC transporter permease PstA [Arenimonas sp.]HMB58126.1 phosphate ABC transporter permease PstA [Arenimonas sp.]
MSAASEKLYRYRRMKNLLALVLSALAALFGLFWLVWILWVTLSKGMSHLNLGLFTQMTPAAGEDGGMLNAFTGSLEIGLLAIVIGTPVGIAAGTYLAEYVNHSKLGTVIRFMNDILLSAPSIVLGMFVYITVVVPMGHASAFAGSIALAFIALPVIVRTTDEMLRLVPSTMREAALSLGIPQWKVTVQVLYRAALPGITTGVLLAFARISGETAPLLFTAGGNQYFTANVLEPMASVPTVMNNFAMSPFENWNGLAWAAAFCMTLFVLALGILARAILLRNKVSHD